LKCDLHEGGGDRFGRGIVLFLRRTMGASTSSSGTRESVARLVKSIWSSDQRKREQAAWAIRNLAAHTANKRLIVTTDGVLSALVHVLREGRADGKEQAERLAARLRAGQRRPREGDDAAGEEDEEGGAGMEMNERPGRPRLEHDGYHVSNDRRIADMELRLREETKPS